MSKFWDRCHHPMPKLGPQKPEPAMRPSGRRDRRRMAESGPDYVKRQLSRGHDRDPYGIDGDEGPKQP